MCDNIFLINATNIKAGGGVQVVQSICNQLGSFTNARFVVVLSTFINDDDINYSDNTIVFKYTIKHSLKTIITGRDNFLDELVSRYNIRAVLTVFGPSIWIPQTAHLCGFARAQLVLKNSPYMKMASLKEKIQYIIWTWAFRKSSKIFYTENEYISLMIPSLIKNSKVYTVNNYYNEVFDFPDHWKNTINLPKFDGVTCLTVSSPSSHKNIGIIEDIIHYLRNIHPEFKVRFVLTFSEEKWPMAEDVRNDIIYVGKIDVSECPSLYKQSDIMFMPTLMECFTATYPEAMRMEVPIVTTDLEFARGLCGDAACYYSAVDARAAAESIYKVGTDKEYAQSLVLNGIKQLTTYDNYEQRAAKLVRILEEIS